MKFGIHVNEYENICPLIQDIWSKFKFMTKFLSNWGWYLEEYHGWMARATLIISLNGRGNKEVIM